MVYNTFFSQICQFLSPKCSTRTQNFQNFLGNIVYIYYGKVLIDNRKGFFIFIKNKKDVPKMFQKKTRKLSKK